MNIRWKIALGILTLLPIIVLSYLGQKIKCFHSALQEAHCITGKQRVISEKNLLSPSKVRVKLKKMHRYNQKTIQNIDTKHRKMLLWFFIYGALGAIYLVIWLLWLKENQHNLKTPFSAIFFLGLCAVVFHTFWIAPLEDFDRQRKSQSNKKLDLLQTMADTAQNGPISWYTRSENYTVLFIVALLTTMFSQYFYLLFWSKFILETTAPQVDYIIALFILILYQYVVQKGIAFLLKKVIICLKLSKYAGHFMEHSVLYQLLKNATYLSCVLITIPTSEIDDSFTASVIGTLFLLDTFFDKRNALLGQLTGTSEPRPPHKPTTCTRCCAPSHYETAATGERETE